MKFRTVAAVAAAALVTATGCGSTEETDSQQGTTADQAVIDSPKKQPKKDKPKPEMTSSQKNAVEAAKSYLEVQPFSKKGLIQQLSSSAGDGYPKADAEFAVDHIEVDWNEQAVKSAKAYLEMQPFSKQELIEQLSSSAGEGFTPAQAKQAADKVY